MKLFYSPNSPYARKCRMIALEKNIPLELVAVNAGEDPPELLAANPLGKIPALVRDDGSVLCESPIICEYLDSLSQPPLIPPSGEARFGVLNLAAVGQGILDAAVAIVIESRRPADKQWDGWVKRQKGKIGRAIDWCALHSLLREDELNLGTITLACALAYVSFRHPELDWRASHPHMAEWLDKMNARESFKKTAPV